MGVKNQYMFTFTFHLKNVHSKQMAQFCLPQKVNIQSLHSVILLYKCSIVHEAVATVQLSTTRKLIEGSSKHKGIK
jgi:hypothetical protein